MTSMQKNALGTLGSQYNLRVLRLNRQRRLPSVETQTVAFVEFARQGGEIMSTWVEWAGFAVYLRYAPSRRLTDSLEVGECIAISTIHIPDRLQHRGWFWRYCQLCLGLVEDALVLEGVVNPSLRASLRQRPEFFEFHDESFVLRRLPDHRWPLRVFPDLNV